MPRKYRKRRRRYRRRAKRAPDRAPWYLRKKWVNDVGMPLSAAAFKGVQYLAGLVNSEIFTAEGDITSTAITTSGHVTNITSISQGDGEHARTGNSVFAKYLTFRGKLIMNASATQTMVRILVVRDKQQVADTAPTVAAVLDGAASSYTYAPMSADNKGRFTKLYDRTIILDPEHQAKALKINLSMRNHVRFNGVNAADIQKGGIYLMLVADEATNTPTYTGFYRLAYHDN